MVSLFLAKNPLLTITAQDAPASVASLFGVHLSAHFNEPYLRFAVHRNLSSNLISFHLGSESVRDFWGKRWNLTAGSILRDAIYQPIIDLVRGLPLYQRDDSSANHKSRAPVSKSWRALAVLAAFAASALAHERILAYAVPPTFEWTLFFMVHGVVTVLESLLDDWLRARKLFWRPPRLLRIAYTLAFIEATFHYLFLPPLERSVLTERLISSFANLAK